MRRSVLFSLLIIGAAISVVVGAGTFGAFSDEENIDGTVTSAIVDFELSGDGASTGTTENPVDETLEISFDALGVTCGFAFFAPGSSCELEIDLTRANILQQLAVDLSVTAFTVEGVGDTNAAPDLDVAAQSIGIDCDSVAGADWHISWDWFDDGGDDDEFMPAANDDTGQRIDVTVSLDGDAQNGCQNSEIDPILITIQALQATPDPHKANDLP
ncbi:MAG: hypothetical protein GEU75_08290 [Dehalococcoidia bacterium]|nr:hypothetical protein [Dehalococcoidia bacterium]